MDNDSMSEPKSPSFPYESDFHNPTRGKTVRYHNIGVLGLIFKQGHFCVHFDIRFYLNVICHRGRGGGHGEPRLK